MAWMVLAAYALMAVSLARISRRFGLCHPRTTTVIEPSRWDILWLAVFTISGTFVGVFTSYSY